MDYGVIKQWQHVVSGNCFTTATIRWWVGGGVQLIKVQGCVRMIGDFGGILKVRGIRKQKRNKISIAATWLTSS